MLRARLRMWGHRGGREETIGAHGKVLKKLAWGRPEQGLRDFTEMIEALSRDLEAGFEGFCVVFQAQP